jgi:hypothetical protein
MSVPDLRILLGGVSVESHSDDGTRVPVAPEPGREPRRRVGMIPVGPITTSLGAPA